MNEKTAKIKYLENGTFKEMEVKPIVKQILDEYYHGYPYMYHSKLVIMDEIGLIETTLKVMKRKVNQLLQEIDKKLKELEKELEYPDPNSYVSGMEDGLLIAKSGIKKAFEVIEE